MKEKYTIEVPVERIGSQIATYCIIPINGQDRILEIRFNDYEIPITEIMGTLPIEDYAYQKAMFENSENCFLEIPITRDHKTDKIAIPKKLKIININQNFAGDAPFYKFASQKYAKVFKMCILKKLKFIRLKMNNPLKDIEDEEYIVQAISLNGKVTKYKTYLSFFTTNKEPFDF